MTPYVSVGQSYVSELAAIFGVEELIMLACPCDESERTEYSPILVLAGFCSSQEQWDFFGEEWLGILKAYGLESPFKMQHYERRKKQFRDFPEEKRKPLMQDLLNAIKNRSFMGIGSVVQIEPYQRLITGGVKDWVGSAYGLAVAGCFWVGGRWARQYSHPGPIAYIFDEGHKNAGDALTTHRKHMQSDEFRKGWRLGPIGFDTDDKMIALQAADLFAYESHRRCTERVIQLMNANQRVTGEHVRYPIIELLKSMRLIVRFFDEETLRQLQESYKKTGKPDYDASANIE